MSYFCLLALFLGALCTATRAQTVGDWTWANGSNVTTYSKVKGVYGTLGQSASTNVPGGRRGSVSWTDASGNLWLFGGYGYDSSGATSQAVLNDLWKYTPATSFTGQWTWMSGSNTKKQSGVYGNLGQVAATNVPGARQYAVSWIDASGNLWLFGGNGYDSAGNLGLLNDLWMYAPSTGQWTWVSGGSTLVNNGAGYTQSGVYGNLGQPASGNVPGGRQNAASWIDTSGNLWLFGGQGIDATGNTLYLNDLWKFNPLTGYWAWISGSNQGDQYGTYGSQGYIEPNNVPGGRYGMASWIDSGNNLWLFGGAGLVSSSSSEGVFNDLWKFDPGANEWMWVSGTSNLNQTGTYSTTTGVSGSGYSPGGRSYATAQVDNSGNFWLFGGSGYDSAGSSGSLNDLWEFAPSTGYWTWVSGSNTVSAKGTYSTSAGGIGSSYSPGSRAAAISWIDSSNNFWLFGGNGYGSTASRGYLNDLWQYMTMATLATPTFSVAAGTYTSIQDVTISDTISGAAIYYTTNGSTPTANSTLYSGNAISVSSTETIQAIAILSGYNNSAVASAAYTINLPTVATPTFLPSGGTYSSTQNVTISDATTGATIHYTTDGSTPTTNSTAYSGGAISVASSETLQAIAVLSGYNNSAVASAIYTINLPAANTPTFSPVGGTYNAAQNVIISDAIAGATIYYTTDGSTPTTSSTVYSGSAIPVTASETIQAIATAPNYTTSSIGSAAYTIVPTAATPVFLPGTGTYTTYQTVTITDSTPGAAIYYTTDGSTPTSSSAHYTGSIAVKWSETIQAIAVASGYNNSAVGSATYTINLPTAATPTFSPSAGIYTSIQSVTISDATTGATIYYTTDGSTPTTSSKIYSSALTVDSSATINAMAVASGYNNSAVASATYTINIPPASVLGALSPAYTTMGSPAFTLTVTGTSFTPASIVYIGSTALTTTYVSSMQLTAQVPASAIASYGHYAITAEEPGQPTSNVMYFVADTINSTAYAPTFSTTTGISTSGSSVSYPVSVPSSVLSVSAACINWPGGCDFNPDPNSSNSGTLVLKPISGAGTSATPQGTYVITVQFTETIPAATTSSAGIVLPVLLLPLWFLRRKMRTKARNAWLTMCMGLILLASASLLVSCGGGAKTTQTPTATTTVLSSSTITLTVQ